MFKATDGPWVAYKRVVKMIGYHDDDHLRRQYNKRSVPPVFVVAPTTD